MKAIDIIERGKKTHIGCDYSYDSVTDTKWSEKVNIKCNKHGMFSIRLDHFLKGGKCPVCSGKTRKTFTKFVEEANKVHDGIYEYIDGTYVNSHTKLPIICKKHGEFLQTPTNHLSGCGCPLCKSEKLSEAFSSTTKKFISKANIVHGENKYDYSNVEYINNHTEVEINCQKHGSFRQLPHNHLQGKGCPYCNESKLEILVGRILDESGIKYERQWRLPWNKRYSIDFFIPLVNLGIECQGEQHFIDGKFTGKETLETIKERDEYKRKTCIDNGIEIIYFSNIINYGCIEDEILLINEIKRRLHIKKLRDFLHSLNISIEENLDDCYNFIIEDKKLVISYVNELDASSKPSSFYSIRLKTFNNKGYRVIHMLGHEIEDERKFNVFMSSVKLHIGIIENRIYARDTEIVILSNKDAKDFEEVCCFHGYRQASVNYGLVLKKDVGNLKKGQLVYVYTFGHNFFGRDSERMEAIRVGTLLNSQVIGGASKVLKHFKSEFGDAKGVKFYVDICHYDSRSMTTIGFENVCEYQHGVLNMFLVKIGEYKPLDVIGRKPNLNKELKDLIEEGKVVTVPTCGVSTFVKDF